jgi:hypothetical protein
MTALPRYSASLQRGANMTIPGAVFLDTCVFDSQNYNYESVAMTAFVKACRQLDLTVVLPKSTEQEVQRHIDKRSNEAAAAIEKAANEIRRKAPFCRNGHTTNL